MAEENGIVHLSVMLKEKLKSILQTCRPDIKIVILYGIIGLKDGTFGKEDKNIVLSINYAIRSAQHEEEKTMKDKNISIESIILKKETENTISNVEEVTRACKTAGLLILSSSYSKISVLNSILQSAGVFDDLKLNNKLSDLGSYAVNNQERNILREYNKNLPQNIVLFGSSGSLRPWFLSQFLSIKIKTIDKPLRVIVALNVPSRNSKILKDMETKLLNFCDHLKSNSASAKQIDIQFMTCELLKKFNIRINSELLTEMLEEKGSNLLTKHGWLPTDPSLKSAALGLNHFLDPYRFWEWENNTEDDLLKEVNKISGFENLNATWLEKEINTNILTSHHVSLKVTLLRQLRQRYLLEAFMNWQLSKKKRSFILEGLIEKLRTPDAKTASMNELEVEEVEDHHTIILLDGIGRINLGEQQSLLNIPTQDSIDFLIGIDNSHAGEGTQIIFLTVGLYQGILSGVIPLLYLNSIPSDVCTFTHTGKNWRYKQNWYHCRTCKLQDNEGVCSICAKVCHANHDIILYAKYSSFFCDCGSKGEEFCKALIKEDKGIN